MMRWKHTIGERHANVNSNYVNGSTPAPAPAPSPSPAPSPAPSPELASAPALEPALSSSVYCLYFMYSTNYTGRVRIYHIRC